MPSPPPTPEVQCLFLERIQRLLAEGSFTATYKFALLHALADLSVERGSDVGGDPLTLTVSDLTAKFTDLYQPQARPFPSPRGTHILKQNTGRQARVVTVLSQASPPLTRKVLRDIDETIRDQPLWKLQTLAGGERLDFLYINDDLYKAREITLHPGVAFCFQVFHGLIIALVRDRWERWVRARNHEILGQRADLHEFLFGSERQNLLGFRAALLEVVGPRCFYTGRAVRRESVAVDHFIPWSRYPADLGHNLVVTTGTTNSSKSDHLAGEEHLERWLSHCVEHGAELQAAFTTYRLPSSLPASLAVAEWSYASLHRSGGRVWQRAKEFKSLSPHWQELFQEARSSLGLA